MNPDANDPAALASSGLPQAAPEADRNVGGLGNQEEAVDTEEFGYDFVPPNQTVSVSVRYRIRGRGQPLP